MAHMRGGLRTPPERRDERVHNTCSASGHEAREHGHDEKTDKNVGEKERLVSGLIGGGLLLHSLRPPFSGLSALKAVLGLALVQRSITGHCTAYGMLGMNTHNRTDTSSIGRSKVQSDRGDHLIIRPLAYVAESDLIRWAEHRAFPIIPCTLCGSQDNLQRVQVKKMIREWERQYPGRIDNMFTAMGNITLSHLMDRNLYPFGTLQPTGVADSGGDKAFDEEPCAPPALPLRLTPIATEDDATEG